MTQEITAAEFKELGELIEAMDKLSITFKEITFENFKVFDSNGDVLGRVISDYGDIRLEVGEFPDA